MTTPAPQAVLVTAPPAPEEPGFFSKTWSWMGENKVASAIIVVLVIIVIYLGLNYMGWIDYFTGGSESKAAGRTASSKKKKSSSRSGGRRTQQETEPDDVDELIDIINE